MKGDYDELIQDSMDEIKSSNISMVEILKQVEIQP